jgi:sialate O-acetylesterase
MCKKFIHVLLVIGVLSTTGISGELKIAGVFSEHMVLQRDQPVPVWGWASPGAPVSLSLAGQSGEAIAGPSGSWRYRFAPIPAGGPHELQVSAGNERIVLSDILTGDVWLCSGQSNMEWPLERSLDGENEVAAATHDAIRLFKVEKSAQPEPRNNLEEERWMTCTPENARSITAVGYFFARDLQQELKVPIGILQSAWGGTRAEAWTEFSFLEQEPALKPLADAYLRDKNLPAEQQRRIADRYNAWKKASIYKDPGTRMDLLGWADTGFDDSSWPEMPLPGLWEGQGLDLDGSVWFRKQVTIPVEWSGEPLVFHAGFIDDYDITYFNGSRIGATDSETRRSSYEARVYPIPDSLVKAGEVNLIAVRVFDGYRRGGIGGDPQDFYIGQSDSDRKLSLSGTWRYQIEHRLYPASDGGPSEPVLPGWRHAPSNLYNGMIAPLVPFAVKGVIWYQGESNADRAEQYKVLFPAMIRSWRSAWQREDLPFYWVQLANYRAPQTGPFEGGWAYIREAQTSALALEQTGMAVITDVGEAGDIHPRDKQTVGHRLARIALAQTYGRDIAYSGPRFKSAEKDGSKVIVHFEHAAGLSTRDGKSPGGFGIRDNAGQWFWADVQIVNDQVILSHPQVNTPAGVSYNWADNPTGNLINEAGLPADSFRAEL